MGSITVTGLPRLGKIRDLTERVEIDGYNMDIYIYVCVYIYICVCVYVYVYIYIERERAKHKVACDR